MSAQPSQPATATAEQTSGPHDSEPTLERQAELRAAFEANVAANKAPYSGVRILTRGEVTWIMAQHGWSGQEDEFTVKYTLIPEGRHSARAEFQDAWLADINLTGMKLRRANLRGANLVRANLADADLVDADLSDTDLGFADFTRANLTWADFGGAHMREASFREARMSFSNLFGARLPRCDLGGANLRNVRMDASTLLADMRLDSRTRLRDVTWNGASLTQIDWDSVRRLGDEERRHAIRKRARRSSRPSRLAHFQSAARAYQQLAVVLRAQGIMDAASRFAYRAQLCQRQAYRRQGIKKWPAYVGSLILWALAGYGYRLWRILVAYGLTVGLFAAGYLGAGILAASGSLPTGQAVLNALQISLNAIHGRVFFAQFGLDTLQSWLATAESIVGIVIEGTFVAMLIQRFFGR
jgi:hypothetical protein